MLFFDCFCYPFSDDGVNLCDLCLNLFYDFQVMCVFVCS